MLLKFGEPGTLMRPPNPTDGASLHQLVSACPPLDENSMYCNLLQCTHFSDTSVVAESSGSLIGAVSGYLVPGRQDTLFIWQVAVAESARGQGLGRLMLQHLLARTVCHQVTHLETTVTQTNTASWRMFKRLARHLGCELERSTLFERETHFRDQHETEILARIGPISDVSQLDSQQETETDVTHQPGAHTG